MNLKIWFMETRPHFLLLTPLAYSVGLAAAFVEGHFDALSALLGLIGSLLAHISINVINDYFDYRSGLDLKTKRTPFSGGSGILPAGLLNPRDVYLFSVGCLVIDGVIGAYFVLTRGWMLLPLILLAGASIYFYTTHLSRWLVGEVITGLNFGPIMVLGGYFIQTGSYSWSVLALGIVPGILVGTLLFLNEFPDREPDMSVGRMNTVIRLGLARSSRIYATLIALTYAWILFSIAIGLMPITTLIAFVTLPIATRAVRGVLRDHGDMERLVPAMGANVMLVLSATAATASGVLLSKWF